MNDYNDINNFHVPDFKLFHLSLYDAARFTAKIRLLEGDLDIDHPDESDFYHLDNPDLDKLLQDHFKTYENALIKAIQNKSLKAAHIERDILDEIDITATYIEIHDLAEWLDKRGTSIYGDFFAEYQDNQFDLYWVAEKAIKAELIRRKNNVRKQNLSDEETIVYLQEQIDVLKKDDKPNTKKEIKPLHTKEKETLLKLLLGLTLTNYEYNPKASRNSTSKEIANDLLLQGLSIDEDTVRKWLNQAKDFLPEDWPNES